jgi:hypothetical protein
MKNINKQNMNTGVKLGGELITRVINSDGSIAYESPPTKNLVQYGGLICYGIAEQEMIARLTLLSLPEHTLAVELP